MSEAASVQMACSENEMRRILVPVRFPVGGVRTHILYTYPHLMEAGFRFTFVLPDEVSTPSFQSDVADWPDVESMVVPMGNRRRDVWTCVRAIRRLLRQRRFSLIHSHGLQVALRAAAANVGLGVPHVATSQALFGPERLTGLMGRIKLFGLGEILRRLDALIVVSDDTRDDHVQHMPALLRGPCKLVTIHNGIRVERFSAAECRQTPEFREQLGLPPDVCLVGFLGRFMDQKGFLQLIDALSLLVTTSTEREFHLLAVGSGDRLVNYQRYLATKPDEVKRAITFLEYTPNPAAILRELDLLVIPSLWEAHPLLPMEAMVTGVPVLGTSCAGLREVLTGTPSVMVPPGDPAALANALARAIAAPWRDLAAAYAPTARQRFDVQRTAEALQCVFERLAGCNVTLHDE